MPDGPNGWDQWGRHVLAELDRAQVERKDITGKLDLLHGDIVQLKLKTAIWGASGGAVFGGGIAAIVKFFGGG